jgi:hypothetical protein
MIAVVGEPVALAHRVVDDGDRRRRTEIVVHGVVEGLRAGLRVTR